MQSWVLFWMSFTQGLSFNGICKCLRGSLQRGEVWEACIRAYAHITQISAMRCAVLGAKTNWLVKLHKQLKSSSHYSWLNVTLPPHNGHINVNTGIKENAGARSRTCTALKMTPWHPPSPHLLPNQYFCCVYIMSIWKWNDKLVN